MKVIEGRGGNDYTIRFYIEKKLTPPLRPGSKICWPIFGVETSISVDRGSGTVWYRLVPARSTTPRERSE